MLKMIAYDLDGTLVEAREWHYVALNRALKEVSNTEIGLKEHLETFNGLPTKKKLQLLTEQKRVEQKDHDLIWRKKQEYTIKTIEEMAQLDNDKIELHEYTSKLKIKSVCVTNSISETAKLMLEKTGQLKYMEFLISNEDVKNPKPHGEGYIKAMLRIGIKTPEECLIVEDAPVGIAAAESTGALIWRINGCEDVTLDRFKEFNFDLS